MADNLELMKTLDDAERAGLGGVPKAARRGHAVYWPGQPTRRAGGRTAESEAFFKSIENSLENTLQSCSPLATGPARLPTGRGR